MKKTDNYSAIVTIENIVGDPSKVDENSLFTLLTRLAIGEGRIFDMGIILASRDDKYSGHVELAEKRLPGRSTFIQSPFQFPYDRIGRRGCWDLFGNAFTRAGFCQGIFGRGAGRSLVEA